MISESYLSNAQILVYTNKKRGVCVCVGVGVGVCLHPVLQGVGLCFIFVLLQYVKPSYCFLVKYNDFISLLASVKKKILPTILW